MLDALSQVAGWVKKNFWAKTDNIILRAGQFLRVGNSQLKDDKLGISTLDVSGNATFSGRVGIGTAAGVKFHVVSSDVVAIVQGDETRSGLAGGQLQIRGNTNLNQRIVFGYDTTDDYGFISCGINNTGYKPLVLHPSDGNVGIGTITPASKLDVNGTMSSTSSLGWTYSRNIPDNAATAIARVNFPSGTLLGSFLVTVSVSATGVRAMRTFIVTMRYNGVDVTALNSPGFIGVSSLDLTASANATARTMTLSAKQVSGAAQTCHIHIQPLAIHYDDTVTFTGL